MLSHHADRHCQITYHRMKTTTPPPQDTPRDQLGEASCNRQCCRVSTLQAQNSRSRQNKRPVENYPWLDFARWQTPSSGQTANYLNTYTYSPTQPPEKSGRTHTATKSDVLRRECLAVTPERTQSSLSHATRSQKSEQRTSPKALSLSSFAQKR